MSEAVTIHQIEVENVKRVKAVSLTLSPTGLTVIGGRNRNGKTSFLDAIAWTLGGERFRPSSPDNTETGGKARTRIELSNGLVVERKGKNGALTVSDPSGARGGQSILDEILCKLAIDQREFLAASAKQKAKILLGVLGVESELNRLEEAERALYAEREVLGKQVKKAKGYAEELPHHEDAPDALISAQEVIQQQQAILLRNAENQKARGNATAIKGEISRLQANIADATKRIADREKRIQEMQAEIKHENEMIAGYQKKNDDLAAKMEASSKSAAELQDESTAELETQLHQIEEINAKVRVNAEKVKARAAAAKMAAEYAEMSLRIGDIRTQINALLEGAALPLPGLSVRGGELEYNGRQWDCMSGAEQLKVATAVVRKLNPKCGFVLVDKLEQMDIETQREFAEWAQTEELQIIGTRVSSSAGECTLIIEDGTILAEEANVTEPAAEDIETDPALCPIAGKFYGRPWVSIAPEVLEWAMENAGDMPELTSAHLDAIRAAM
jgi:hypothetical protein